MSGQLYTTHLLSLEALLTVIDSIEAHCQARVLSSIAQQDQAETALADGEGAAKAETDSVSASTGISTDNFTPHRCSLGVILLSFSPLSCD